MKSTMRMKRGAGLALLLHLFLTNPMAAQSRQQEALNWFKIGLQEKEASTKIFAYRKAITLDSLFVEAWYNLGTTYKKQQDYARAENCLRRAYALRHESGAQEIKAVIVYELATTYKKLGQSERFETHLLEAKTLANERKIKTRIALDLGRLYNEREEYTKALAELREGQQLEPTNSEFTKLIASIETAAALQQLYAAALQNLASNRLNEAKTQFETIAAQAPDYKDLRARMTEMDSLLKTENQKQAFALAYEQAQNHEAEGKLELAISAYESLLRQSSNYKDAQARLENARQLLAHNAREEKNRLLESEYNAGTVALKQQDWTGAIISFKRVVESDPGFRDARGKLNEAQSGLSGESLNATVALFYEEGMAALKRNNIAEAHAALEKVRLLNPTYRDVSARLAELAKTTQPSQPLSQPAQTMGAASSPLDSLYHSALALMVKEEWAAALQTLNTLQARSPNYRDTADLLVRAQRHIQQPEPGMSTPLNAETDSPQRRTVLLLSCGFVLTLLGFYCLSAPTTRVRLLLWRGRNKEAVAIYETLLLRNPQQTSLYPVLTDLYLRAGRNDEMAMRVYRRALQLDLPERKRKTIRDFVAQNQASEEQARIEALAEKEHAVSRFTTDAF